MIKLFLDIWPSFIPLAIFMVWYFKNRINTEQEAQDKFLNKKRRYMFYALVSSLILIIAMLLYLGLTQTQMQHIDINNDRVQNNVH